MQEQMHKRMQKQSHSPERGRHEVMDADAVRERGAGQEDDELLELGHGQDLLLADREERAGEAVQDLDALDEHAVPPERGGTQGMAASVRRRLDPHPSGRVSGVLL